jgi:rfaE bifunctional protein nucleotidyltransferase chain/domain
MSKIIKDIEVSKLSKGKIVLVGGCFDILHPAHIEFLRLSKKEGDILVILLESDTNIKKNKGEKRPLNNQDTRAENLSKLSEVDYVILLKTPDSSQYYYNLVKSIRPDIIAVTKGDPLLSVKKEQATIVGGKVVEVMERDIRHSSSELINKG